MAFVARRPITVLARKYKAGDLVPVDKWPEPLRAKLLAARYIVPDDKKRA